MSDMRGRLYSSVALAWRWSRLHNWSDHHALVAETQRASTCVAQLNSPEPAALQEVGESADPGVRFTQPIFFTLPFERRAEGTTAGIAARADPGAGPAAQPSKGRDGSSPGWAR